MLYQSLALALCVPLVVVDVTYPHVRKTLDAKAVKAFAVRTVKTSTFSTSEKPQYAVVKEDGKVVLHYGAGASSRLYTESYRAIDNLVVDYHVKIEKYRAFPPPKFDRASWDKALDACEAVPTKLIADYTAGKLLNMPGDDAYIGADQRFESLVRAAVNGQAALNGATGVAYHSKGNHMTTGIGRIPAGFTLCLMSEFGWTQHLALGQNPTDEITRCRAWDFLSAPKGLLDGKVWCWIRRADGTTFGPRLITASDADQHLAR